MPGAAIGLGNEAAFGDENADKNFLGQRGLGPGTIFDSKLGQGSAVGGTVAGAVAGAAGGAALGMGLSSIATQGLKDTNIHSAITGSINPPLANAGNSTGKFADNIPLLGGRKVPKSLLKPGIHSPKVRGLGAIGAIAGAAIGGSAYLKSYVGRNKDFMESNPYNRGSAMQASSTGAYGDVVFGMYNSRKG